MNYYRPQTLADALTLKQKHGDSAAWLAGGSHLNRGDTESRPVTLISLENLELNTLKVDDKDYTIGAMVTLQEIIDSPAIHNDLQQAMALLFNRNVRNQTTLGGEIANKDSRSPVLAALLAACAQLTVCDLHGDEHSLSLEQYIQEDREDLILTVSIPLNLKALKVHKVAHTAGAAPILTAAVCHQIDDTGKDGWNLALSGVAEKPMRLRDAEALINDDCDQETLAKAVSEAVFPIDDFRASAEYRREVSGVVIARLVNEIVAELEQGA